jgi:hypothetical protein
MENESFGQRLKSGSMKFLKRVLIFGILLFLIIASFLYFATYESGVMAGRVLRISEKGMIFKTYEGKLSLESFGALKGASPIAETFDFSVEPSQKEVLKQLEEVALKGERVNLHFKKRYMRFPWRGETKYFIERVERVE